MVEFSLIGKTILQKMFREYGKPFRSRSVEKIISVFNLQKLDELYAHIGEGRLEPELVLEKLHPDLATSRKIPKSGGGGNGRGDAGAPMLRIKGGYAGDCDKYRALLSSASRRAYCWHFYNRQRRYRTPQRLWQSVEF